MKDRNTIVDFAIYDDLSADAIEGLEIILEADQGRPFTFDETKEIAVSLLKLFEVLAEPDEVREEKIQEEEAHEGLESTQLSFI